MQYRVGVNGRPTAGLGQEQMLYRDPTTGMLAPAGATGVTGVIFDPQHPAHPFNWPWWVWASIVGVGVFVFLPSGRR